MFSFKNIFIFTISLLGSFAMFAQPGLETGEVEVIKDFEARLADAEKLGVLPGLPPLDTASRRLSYTVPTKSVPVDYPPPTLRPLGMKRSKVDPGYRGFVKLGYGIPNSPYGEFGYNLGNANKNYNLGLHLLHHSANFENDEIQHQRFALTDAELKGTYYLQEGGMALGGRLGYTVDQVHYYGYDPSLSVSGDTMLNREQVKQQFTTLGGGVSLFNGERNDFDVSYNAGLNFYLLDDNYSSNETGFDLELSGSKWFQEKHPLTLTIKSDFTNFTDTADHKLNNFYLQPNFTYHSDNFRIKAGLNLVSHEDEFDLLPDVEASVAVLGARLAAFAGWKGDYVKNNMKRLSDYNPYVATFGKLDLRNTVYTHYFGGVRGNLGVIEYNGQIGYKNAKDLALFLRDSTDLRSRFLVVYDTVDIFNIEGVVTANLFKGFELSAALTSNVYTPKNEAKAWHLPSLEVNISASYLTLEDNLRLKAELYVENGVPYQLNDKGEADNLNGLFDLSFGADYQLTKNFGFFLNLNNIAGNKRQRWDRYPTYGINILGGVKARF